MPLPVPVERVNSNDQMIISNWQEGIRVSFFFTRKTFSSEVRSSIGYFVKLVSFCLALFN